MTYGDRIRTTAESGSDGDEVGGRPAPDERLMSAGPHEIWIPVGPHTWEMDDRLPEKPLFGLRSERASWVVLWIVLLLPVWAVVLWILDPEIAELWPFMVLSFVLYLAVPVYSIVWFRRRRREKTAAERRN